MLRCTPIRRVLPAHPFSLGRPAERGFLYRPSMLNQYNRLSIVDQIQHTAEERRLLYFVRFPDITSLVYFHLIFGFLITVAWITTKPMQHNANKERTLMGAMNQHELWKRNREMAQIFEYHRQLIEQTREQYIPVRPSVFDPPTEGSANWTSEKH